MTKYRQDAPGEGRIGSQFVRTWILSCARRKGMAGPGTPFSETTSCSKRLGPGVEAGSSKLRPVGTWIVRATKRQGCVMITSGGAPGHPFASWRTDRMGTGIGSTLENWRKVTENPA